MNTIINNDYDYKSWLLSLIIIIITMITIIIIIIIMIIIIIIILTIMVIIIMIIIIIMIPARGPQTGCFAYFNSKFQSNFKCKSKLI